MRTSLVALVCALLSPAAAVRAQQPLERFLDAASRSALDLREAQAALDAARSQVDEARARLLPGVTGQAVYQHNEPAVVVTIPAGVDPMTGMPILRQSTITAADQVTVAALATMPVLDLGAWSGWLQSEALADAADGQRDAALLAVQGAVIQLWHQVASARAIEAAAARALSAAEHVRLAVESRVNAGVAPPLELARADAEVARARQAVADTHLGTVLVERGLANLTGLVPDGTQVRLEDDRRPADPLQTFLDRTAQLPAVRAARAQDRAADIARDAAWFALLPSIAAQASARWTNAAGFARQDTYYVGLSATWVLDFLRPAQIGTRSAQQRLADVRAERVVQATETAVFEAWQRVDAARARAEAAAAAEAATARAATDARARFAAGAGTQLEQIQAERDLFQAEVGHIQATAELRVARALLRSRAGLPPG